MDQADIARHFIEAIPFSQALGMRFDRLDPGHAVLSMPYNAELIGDPATGVIHGGAVSALLDTCAGAAVISHPAGTSTSATINLRIDYMRAAKPGQRITAEAECYHVTRSVAFIRATARDEEADAPPVATAAGAFTFVRSAP